jgi:RHH-type proline utilization regulon transcriptional repressor/proline dehydrogenase/delta 1-pyrroline-5-carboxylate dehydrogenase
MAFDPLSALSAAPLGNPYADEAARVMALAADFGMDLPAMKPALEHAALLATQVRAGGNPPFAVETLLREYPISSAEGLALMRLAEALLRVPDTATANALIADRLDAGDWLAHAMAGHGLLGTTSGFALWAADKITGTPGEAATRGLLGRLGEATVRAATLRAMGLMGEQFVLGHTIERALKRSGESDQRGYRHSFDMLGEGARGMEDAGRYFDAYERAIHAIGAAMHGRGPQAGPGISIKLSALHPRYEEAQRERVFAELLPRVRQLAGLAARYDMGLTIDAEESERLEISLDLFRALLADPATQGWEGLGLAVQAYGKRAQAAIARVTDAAREHKRRIMLRLVKGAYWDSEIKAAQERGLPGYPVYTRKPYTDLSYLVCARQLLEARDTVYPQFATHNALSIATILAMAGDGKGFEFQRLHGMGDALYRALRSEPRHAALPCRVYAPVGEHRDLLAYLVRRLIENGANSSFVQQIADPEVPLDVLLAHPMETVIAHQGAPNPDLPLPAGILGARRNSAGLDLMHPGVLAQLLSSLREPREVPHAAPLVPGARSGEAPVPVRNPAQASDIVGSVTAADAQTVDIAFTNAKKAARAWSATSAEARAAMLERAADLLEAHTVELMALCVREAGKTLPDAIAEIREAVDFCRYYAAEARRLFGAPISLPGVTGESNQLSLHGRGVFACISPWNFPLAIFIGQVTAALAAGNCVIAKPADQTPLIAFRATQLLHEAGIPPEVLQLVPGSGAQVGGLLTAHPATAGVAFTGSTATGRAINRSLAAREAAIAPLIAETGGLNAMIVDSTALPEQVVDAVITSAFRSAGQRCSALRVLYVQEEIADNLVRMLAGAARELRVGDPLHPATDVGPVIDAQALSRLRAHAVKLRAAGRLLFEAPVPDDLPEGHFIAPCAFALSSMAELPGEVFGPILHIIRYRADRLAAVVDEINASGYGLTFGIQTRIDSRAAGLHAQVAAGNCYVNRNIIGAVVGCQPFGGEGLSGTGPKAGGPHYLLRFACERTLTVNTAAAGGNVQLVAGGT